MTRRPEGCLKEKDTVYVYVIIYSGSTAQSQIEPLYIAKRKKGGNQTYVQRKQFT